MSDLAKIISQGGAIIESCSVVHSESDVIVLLLSMKTKYCDVLGSCNDPGVIIGISEYSIHIGENREMTEVSFPRYRGYEVVLADCSRYSCYVVLMKNFSKIEPKETIFFENEKAEGGVDE